MWDIRGMSPFKGPLFLLLLLLLLLLFVAGRRHILVARDGCDDEDAAG